MKIEQESKENEVNKEGYLIPKKDVQMNFPDRVKNEWKKIKSLSGPERRKYLKMYYLSGAIILALVLICVIWIVKDMVSQKKIVLSGIFVNCSLADPEGYKLVSDDYFEAIGGNPDKETVSVTWDYYVDLGDSGVQTEGSETLSALTAHMAVGDYYFMILSKDAYEYLLPLESFVSADIIMDEELRSAYSAYIVEGTIVSYGESQSYPAAICLNDTAFAEKYGLSEDCYLVICTREKEDDYAREFLRYFEKYL